MTIRQNVRNLLVGATLAEAKVFIINAIERGDYDCARYAEEFISNYADDFVECEGCYCNPCECLPNDCNCDPE